MDNAELLKQLAEEQKRTNLLLAMAERRARQAAYDAERAKIAASCGVDSSQVEWDGGATFTVFPRTPPQGQDA